MLTAYVKTFCTSNVYPSSISGATGSTISATVGSPPNEYDISRELGNFFHNLEGAFESFAQIVYYVYPLSPSLDAQTVTFATVSNEMITNFPREKLSDYIITIQKEQWFKDLTGFRIKEYHKHSIPFWVNRGRGFLDTSWQTVIWLPDKPLKKKVSYLKKREICRTCEYILREGVNAIDHISGLMEARINAVGHIPI